MTTPTVAKPPGPSTKLSVTLLVVGLVVLIGGVIFAIASIVSNVTDFVDAPLIRGVSVYPVHLGTGKYIVYSDSDFNPLSPEDIRITSPTGSPVAASFYNSSNETLTRDSRRFSARLQFHADTSGTYNVRVTSANDVVIARSLLDTVKRSVPGWLIAFVGLIGSHTKAARFAHRLARDGLEAQRIARLVCPIGIAGIASKRPEAIAIGVAAQLLRLREANWDSAGAHERGRRSARSS